MNLNRKNRKPNPIHDVTGPVRWPQQEAKFVREQKAKRQGPPVKFVEEWNSRDGLVKPDQEK